MTARKPIWLAAASLAALTVGVYLSGCATTEPGGQLKDNQAPRVWLASGPPEGTVQSYTVRLFWGGWDPDGEIQYYEYAITDNDAGVFNPADTTGRDKWRRVFTNRLKVIFHRPT